MTQLKPTTSKKHSLQTIKKIRKSQSKSFRRVLQLTPNLKYVNEFESIKEASRRTGISRTGICNCLSKNNQTWKSGGYVWCYIEEFSKESLKRLRKDSLDA